jgi:hypothetical protein
MSEQEESKEKVKLDSQDAESLEDEPPLYEVGSVSKKSWLGLLSPSILIALSCRALISFFISIAVLIASVILYAFLYWLLIPKALHHFPVHFDYSRRNLDSDTWAVAKVNLLSRQFEVHDLTKYLHQERSSLLQAYERYDVFLKVEYSNSKTNKACGRFSG